MNILRQAFVYFLVVSLSTLAIAQPVQAALISTEQMSTWQSREANQYKIHRALDRPELVRQLESMGVSADQARQRVDALTDQELAMLADQTDRLPAGGDFFGTVGLIFIILLITDILGFTKVFPFTRAQR